MPVIRLGAAASRQIGARPAAVKSYTLTGYKLFCGLFYFLGKREKFGYQSR
nr:MAG TPA: hypothetical protein [Bacteriophage sp.]